MTRRPPTVSRRAFLAAAAGTLAGLALPGRGRAMGDASRFTIGQIQHAGRWNPRPTALKRLLWELSRRTSVET
ncbi:MAG TPA: hypothetical protein VD838_09795, partial [Anaeromyxobacteraceae bacterium]|nr:hypothetical protein [Anaeromyxobacteraceae bacterium]